jgi:hypothetical protein
MKTSTYAEAQIIAILRKAEGGGPVGNRVTGGNPPILNGVYP